MSKNIREAIASTQLFFKNRFGIDLTEESARYTVERVVGVFLMLDKWSRESVIKKTYSYSYRAGIKVDFHHYAFDKSKYSFIRVH